jgi:hypothetical protein
MGIKWAEPGRNGGGDFIGSQGIQRTAVLEEEEEEEEEIEEEEEEEER